MSMESTLFDLKPEHPRMSSCPFSERRSAHIEGDHQICALGYNQPVPESLTRPRPSLTLNYICLIEVQRPVARYTK